MARRLLILSLVLLCGLPATAFAQNTASLLGVVTDESKGVLPGVTITATEVASGRQHVATTDDRGAYRLPSMLPGTYNLQAELAGFATVLVSNVELLVGQSATMSLALKVATVNETVTVSGQAPLINTQSPVVGGNIDRRQMSELPVLGRNWMDMSMLVKGITANTMAGNRAGAQRDDQVQLNLDGQQITQNISASDSFGQPALSREAIAEYQLSTSMYDVTQGRSVGIQVQAISRAGTNNLHGAVYGNFRDDSLNAEDFVAQRVLPYANQQAGFSIGGPIVRNKLHYFGTYEYERQPDTAFINPQTWANAPVSSISFQTKQQQHNMLVRGDYQVSRDDRLSVRGMYWDSKAPFSNLAGNPYPTSAADALRSNVSINANWAKVLRGNLLQEIKVGYSKYKFANLLSDGVPPTPVYQQPGLTAIGASRSYPQSFYQQMPSVRYDLTWHKGTHDIKLGGDFLLREDGAYWPNQERGVFNITGETAASWSRRFPLDAWNDTSRWDLTGLNAQNYTVNFAYDFGVLLPRKTWAVWLNDTWAINDRLTLNAGVRWDVDWGGLDSPGNVDYPVSITNGFDPASTNFGYTTGIRDLTNVGPRGGLTYKVNDSLIVRGGAGLFYNFQESNLLTGTQQQITNERRVIAALITNAPVRPDFITNPLGTATPEDYLSGALPLPPLALRDLDPGYRNPRSLQATVGFQKQLGPVVGFDADLMYTKGTRLGYDRDVNQFYDQATGYPKNSQFGRPNVDYGTVRYYYSNLESEYLALASSFTRRMRDKWQMGGTYTLMFLANDHNTGGLGFTANNSNPFCQTCEWGTANTFQRHTVRLNGIYEAPWGFSLSGIYSFGSGTPTAISYNNTKANYPIQIGGTSFSTNRYVTAPLEIPREVTFPDGSVHNVYDMLADGTPITYSEGDELPRNAFRGLPISKLDLRVSKIVGIPGTNTRVTGMFEVFNLFNHANYSAYNGVLNTPNFGRPTSSFQPRTIQLAFRVDY